MLSQHTRTSRVKATGKLPGEQSSVLYRTERKGASENLGIEKRRIRHWAKLTAKNKVRQPCSEEGRDTMTTETEEQGEVRMCPRQTERLATDAGERSGLRWCAPVKLAAETTYQGMKVRDWPQTLKSRERQCCNGSTGNDDSHSSRKDAGVTEYNSNSMRHKRTAFGDECHQRLCTLPFCQMLLTSMMHHYPRQIHTSTILCKPCNLLLNLPLPMLLKILIYTV